MPRPQSTISRQLFASIVCAVALKKQFDSPETVAQRLAAIRERQISDLETVIAAGSECLPTTVTWRDAFCHECEAQETMFATARQFAVHCFDARWIAESVKSFRLNCPNCQEVE